MWWCVCVCVHVISEVRCNFFPFSPDECWSHLWLCKTSLKVGMEVEVNVSERKKMDKQWKIAYQRGRYFCSWCSAPRSFFFSPSALLLLLIPHSHMCTNTHHTGSCLSNVGPNIQIYMGWGDTQVIRWAGQSSVRVVTSSRRRAGSLRVILIKCRSVLSGTECSCEGMRDGWAYQRWSEGWQTHTFVMMAGHVMSGQDSSITHPFKYLLMNPANMWA